MRTSGIKRGCERDPFMLTYLNSQGAQSRMYITHEYSGYFLRSGVSAIGPFAELKNGLLAALEQFGGRMPDAQLEREIDELSKAFSEAERNDMIGAVSIEFRGDEILAPRILRDLPDNIRNELNSTPMDRGSQCILGIEIVDIDGPWINKPIGRLVNASVMGHSLFLDFGLKKILYVTMQNEAECHSMLAQFTRRIGKEIVTIDSVNGILHVAFLKKSDGTASITRSRFSSHRRINA